MNMSDSPSPQSLCNINPQERRQRLAAGFVGLVLTIVCLSAFFLLDVPRIWRWSLIVPVGIMVAGFVQWRLRFCMAYGLGAGPGAGAEEGLRLAARRRAVRLLILTTVIAVGCAAAAYFIPA